MDETPEVRALKADALSSMNEVRRLLGQPSLTAFPERNCAFCGSPEEDAGALFRSDILEFIRICRPCTTKAQRAFMRDPTLGGGSAL